MRVTLVVCMAANRVIGRTGGMPWRMPSDLRHLRVVTLGKPIVMGRKTFQSIGKPLDGRTNYVVTRQREFSPAGVVVVAAVADAIAAERAKGSADLMILGGGEVYAATLADADRIVMTELKATIDGDTRFPVLDPATWHEVSRSPLATGPKDDYAADIIVYERQH